MDELAETIERTAAETGFTGTVSVERSGEAPYQAAFGERDRSNHLPNTVDTRFGIASGTKLLTALGVGVLVDQGKLSADTPVGDVRSDFHTFIDPRATVGQLLSHTSGAFDYFDEEVIEDFDNFYVDIPWHRLATPGDYLPLFAGRPMKFAPGERFSYSNGGYILLGVLIETLSGQLYRDFIQDHVLQPAGMDASGFFALNDLPENVAVGYVGDGSRSNIYNLPIRGASDGGCYTTLADINRLWPAFLGHAIVSEATTRQMLLPHVRFERPGPPSGYGYGLYWRQTEKGGTVLYIVGSDAGVGFYSAHVPDEGITVSILSNTTDGDAPMRRTILACLGL